MRGGEQGAGNQRKDDAMRSFHREGGLRTGAEWNVSMGKKCWGCTGKLRLACCDVWDGDLDTKSWAIGSRVLEVVETGMEKKAVISTKGVIQAHRPSNTINNL